MYIQKTQQDKQVAKIAAHTHTQNDLYYFVSCVVVDTTHSKQQRKVPFPFLVVPYPCLFCVWPFFMVRKLSVVVEFMCFSWHNTVIQSVYRGFLAAG